MTNINNKINDFLEKYKDKKDNELISEDYTITEYSKNRYALTIDIYSSFIFYLGIPFESYIEIFKNAKL
ncbi:hypothetical protein [Spiroplasma endosymbiont of Tipula paludosa]|uniref:hypothetical protein n=1 Tax=Spiroplasma endosymbiont of Tipula paludosa TaxID=3066295 RepID=UPI0035C904FF